MSTPYLAYAFEGFAGTVVSSAVVWASRLRRRRVTQPQVVDAWQKQSSELVKRLNAQHDAEIERLTKQHDAEIAYLRAELTKCQENQRRGGHLND